MLDGAPVQDARPSTAGTSSTVMPSTSAKVLGTGRKNADGTPMPVQDIKVYLTQHDMLSQLRLSEGRGPVRPGDLQAVFHGPVRR